MQRPGSRHMRRLVTLLLLVAAVSMSVVQAKTLAKECESNADCSEGATCVAGDSETSVQRCVAGAPCGGSNIGSCPADPATGQLACIWRPNTKACSGGAASGCKQIGSEYGIYKCISLDRCDKYFGDSLCSGGCNVNGVQCNGRGNCQVSYESDVPSFQCACDSGWNGTKCDNVLNDSCVVDVGQCGTHGTCVKNACECKNGYTGEQCEIAPAGSGSLSGSMGSSNSSSNSSSSNSSSNSSSSNSTSSSPTSSSSTVVTPKPNQAGSAASNTDSVSDGKNSKSPTFILVGLLAAVIIVAALLFALYSRKKKREQDAAGGFARTGSIDEGVDGAAIAGGPDTPKQNIVIM